MSQIFIYSPDDLLQCVLANDGSSKCPFWDDSITEKLNGQLNLEFTIPETHPDSKYLQAGANVVVKSLDSTYKLFTIVKVQGVYGYDSNELQVECDGAYYELGEHLIAKLGLLNVDVSIAMKSVLGDTKWNVGYVEPALMKDKYDIAFTMEDGLSSIQRVLDKWKCEARYRVEVSNGKISGRFIDLYKARGAYRGVKFTFDRNLKTVERVVDFTEVKTRMYGKGQTLFTNKDGTYEWVDFQDMVWDTSKGDPVNKPKGQIYVENPEAVERWGIRNGVYEEGTEDIKVLLEHTWDTLKKHANPKVSYTLDAVDLSQQQGYEHLHVELGDTVVVTDLDLGINFGARVQEIKWTLTNPMDVKYTIGDFMELITDKFMKIFNQYKDILDTVTKDRLDTSDAILKITQTTSDLKIEIDSNKAELHNEITFSISGLRSELYDMGNGLNSKIEQTNSLIHSEVNNLDKKLSSEITQTADRIDLTVAQLSTDVEGKADSDKLISSINLSPEKIKISSNRLEIDGLVSFEDLKTPGATVIEGGTIRSSDIYGGNIDTQNFSAHGEIWLYSHTTVGQRLEVRGGVGIQGTNNSGNGLDCDGSALINKNLEVRGKKNCAVATKDYGTVLMNAFEFPEVYLGDIGWGNTDANGIAVIPFRDSLRQVINTDIAYHIQLTMNGGVHKKIEYFPTHFVVYAEPNTEFSWILLGKRLGYENEGLMTKEEKYVPVDEVAKLSLEVGWENRLSNVLGV